MYDLSRVVSAELNTGQILLAKTFEIEELALMDKETQHPSHCFPLFFLHTAIAKRLEVLKEPLNLWTFA